MSKRHSYVDDLTYDHDRLFASTDELKAFIAERGKRIGWNYETCVHMANHSDEMDYPELREDIRKCVWLLQYAEQLYAESPKQEGKWIKEW